MALLPNWPRIWIWSKQQCARACLDSRKDTERFFNQKLGIPLGKKEMSNRNYALFLQCLPVRHYDLAACLSQTRKISVAIIKRINRACFQKMPPLRPRTKGRFGLWAFHLSPSVTRLGTNQRQRRSRNRRKTGRLAW